MVFANRIYANPSTPNEMFVNFGFNTRGFQKYPSYVPEVFAGHVSKEEYDDTIGAIKAVLDEGALNPTLTCVSLNCCCVMCGCGLPCAMYHFGEALNAKLDEAVATSVAKWKTRMPVYLQGTFRGSAREEDNWVDARGEPAYLQGTRKGPPEGYSLVITLPQAPAQWPPPATVMVAPGAAPAADAESVADEIKKLSVADEIKKLYELKEQGVLTKAEFDKAKAKVLA